MFEILHTMQAELHVKNQAYVLKNSAHNTSKFEEWISISRWRGADGALQMMSGGRSDDVNEVVYHYATVNTITNIFDSIGPSTAED